MKKVLVTFVLALTTAALAQGGSPSGTQGASSDQGQSGNVPTNQKVIKDPGEYNSYITALNTQDPAAKAQAMEAFIVQYPQSIVKIDALEQAMAAYQQIMAANQQPGNEAKAQEATSKVLDTASKILEVNPNNVRALAVMTFIERSRAADASMSAKVRADAEKGLKALDGWKPEGMSDAEVEKLKNEMAEIFEGAAGFGAIDVKGLWYIAKAYNLAGDNVDGKKAISSYGQSKYKKYHGGVDGWDKILTAAATQAAIPAEFTVKAAPTECEIAADAVKQNPADKLSFSDWEFVLSHRDCSAAAGDAAKQVWQVIVAKQKNGDVKLKLEKVKDISATKNFIDAALTEENQQTDKADVHIVLGKPVLKPPAAGTSIDIVGVLTAYAPDPFMFTMEKGELPAAAKRKPPVHHAGTARKRVG